MNSYIVDGQEFYHHGIKGMKWGRRRFQNQDGSLTPAGKKRYSSDVGEAKATYKQAKKDYNKAFNSAYNKNIGSFSPIKKHREASTKRWEDAIDKAEAVNEAKANLKGAKAARKIERKYDKVGKNLGKADYYREKGEQSAQKHERNATVFDKQAKTYESRGEYFKAEAARKAADAIRARGSNTQAEQERVAAAYERLASKQTQKVSAYADKKRVDIGKKKVDAILSESKKKGYNTAKATDEAAREWELQERLGDDGYEVYNKIRGRR